MPRLQKSEPKKHFQIQRLFGLAKPKADLAKLDVHDYLADIAAAVTQSRTSSLKDLTFEEANDMIVALGGTAFSFFKRSKRTENYHRQQAGIKTIVTAAHLFKMEELWGEYEHRTPDGLTALCERINHVPSPRTSEECNNVIEAIKSINKREAKKMEGPAQPTFRRVA